MFTNVVVGIAVYLVAGVVAVLTPPLATKLSEPFLEFRAAINGTPIWRVKMYWITVRVIVVVGWPIFYLVVLYDAVQDRKRQKQAEKIQREKTPEDTGLFFKWMGGRGAVRCNACGYEEKVTCFLHWLGPTGKDTQTGFQCQSCGKFHSVENADLTTQVRCSCGGELSRDKTVFCPQCKSRDVSYQPHIIT
jgi:hypothetical protein